MKTYTQLAKNFSSISDDDFEYNTIILENLFSTPQTIIGKMVRKIDKRHIHYTLLEISSDEPIANDIKLAEIKNPNKKYFFCINDNRQTMSTIEINIKSGFIKFIELIENGKFTKGQATKPTHIIFDENLPIVESIKTLHNL